MKKVNCKSVVEMGGKSKDISTLLSSSSSKSSSKYSRHHHHHNQQGFTSSRRCLVGSVKYPNHSKSCSHHSRHGNVAIATQVISPSAIGGSLSKRRIVRPFGSSREEDEESFFGRKHRAVWGKFFCYSMSVAVIVLIMTGTVLAVGYMQSEKQKILSRSVLMARSNVANAISTQENFESEIDQSQEIESSETTNENDNGNNNENEKAKEPRFVNEQEDDLQNLDSSSVSDNENETSTTESHSLPSEVKVLPPSDFHFSGFSFQVPIYKDNNTKEKDNSDNNRLNDDNKSFTFSLDPIDHHEFESESKVTSSAGINKQFSISGFNFSIEPEKSEKTDYGTLIFPKGSLEDIPIVAKLQTDLFSEDEDHTNDNDNTSRSDNYRSGHRHPIKMHKQDHTYTPKPSSSSRYSTTEKLRNFKASKKLDPIDVPSLLSHPTPTTPLPTTATFTNNQGSKLDNTDVLKWQYSQPVATTPSPNKAASPELKFYDFDLTNFSHLVPTTIASSTDSTSTSSLSNNLNSFNFNLKPQNSDGSVPTSNNIELTQISLPSTTSTTTTTSTAHQDNQFSKRTFPVFDGNNPFAHLLGNSPSTGVIGLPSSVGATNAYNFGDNSYLPPSTSHLAPGTIPLDLASSYIQVGNPGGNSANSGNNDHSGSYSYSNPTLALASLIQNQGGGGQGYLNYYNPSNSGGGQNNQFSVVTDGSGKGPDYNSVTQGIHLLNLLSGNIPQQLYNDHQTASTFQAVQSQNFAKPEYQIAALAGYGGSAQNFGNPYLSHSQSTIEQRSLPSSDLHSSKGYPNNIADQIASASQNSFSQSILKGDTSESSTIKDAIASYSSTHPKTISFSILPENKIKLDMQDEKKSNENSDTLSLTSRKKELFGAIKNSPIVDYLRNSDMDTASSEIRDLFTTSIFQVVTPKPVKKETTFGRKLIIKTIKIKNDMSDRPSESFERGLKSGFYI